MGSLFFNNGEIREGKTRVAAASKYAEPAHDVITAYPGETLASITERAYGINTPGNRARIESANANLEGLINVPR